MVFYFAIAVIACKKTSLPRDEPQVTFAVPTKEHFAGQHAILVVCQ